MSPQLLLTAKAVRGEDCQRFTKASRRFLAIFRKVIAGSSPTYFFARISGLASEFRYRRLLTKARIVGRVRFSGTGTFKIGSAFNITSINTVSVIDCAKGAELTIGENAALNYGVIISSRKAVSIGRNVMIGNMVVIADTLCPMFDDAPAHRCEVPSPVKIGDNVWLAARVTVLPGSDIGNGAVVGAGSIVQGKIPSGAIAIGIPARPIMLHQANDPGTNLRAGSLK